MADSEGGLSTALVRAARVAAGIAGETAETVAGGVSAVWDFNKRAIETVETVAAPVLRPLDVIGVTDLVRRPAEAVVERVEATVDRLEESGEAALRVTGQATITTVGATIDAVLEYLADNPEVDALVLRLVRRVLPLLADDPAVEALVRTQVDKVLPQLSDSEAISALVRGQVDSVLPALNDHEGLQALIRAQGDIYIDYLNAHPDAVQNLVAGQSASLASEVMDEVRQRTVTADSFIEMIARNLLRRKTREELPPPPEIVQRRAEHVRLPSDFTIEKGNGYEG